METTIKILQVLGSLDMGGAESRMMDVFRKIDRSKYEFTFLTMKEGKQYYEDEILSLGGKIIKLQPPRESGVFKNFSELRKVMEDGKFDAVHSHTSFHSGMAMLAAKKAGIPVRVAHSRTTDSKNKSLKNKVALAIGRILIAKYATERLAISPEAGKFLFGKKPFMVIPNAIDCDKYLETPEEKAKELKSKYNIPQDSICLGLVGRFHRMKNQTFAVDVFNEYYEKNKNSYLIFVGDGTERNNIEQKVSDLSLSQNVIFTGIQSNVNEWMKVFNVLLVPSTFEGLGGVILEAQAAGTPVIKSSTFTDESDMQLGLVKKLPINEGTKIWTNAIENTLDAKKPSKEEIKNSFDKRGYSLNSEIEKLKKLYSKNK